MLGRFGHSFRFALTRMLFRTGGCRLLPARLCIPGQCRIPRHTWRKYISQLHEYSTIPTNTPLVSMPSPDVRGARSHTFQCLRRTTPGLRFSHAHAYAPATQTPTPPVRSPYSCLLIQLPKMRSHSSYTRATYPLPHQRRKRKPSTLPGATYRHSGLIRTCIFQNWKDTRVLDELHAICCQVQFLRIHYISVRAALVGLNSSLHPTTTWITHAPLPNWAVVSGGHGCLPPARPPHLPACWQPLRAQSGGTDSTTPQLGCGVRHFCIPDCNSLAVWDMVSGWDIAPTLPPPHPSG